MLSNVKIVTLDYTDTSIFLEKLKFELATKFHCEISNLPDNYGYSKPWGLLSMIKSSAIDTYQLIYHHDNFWAATGGRIVSHNGEKIYQGSFRGFSSQSNRHVGLGVSSLVNLYNTKYQIERAKVHGCSKFIISFNEHNQRLFRVTHNILLPKSLPDFQFIASERMEIFNNTPQWLITLDLRML